MYGPVQGIKVCAVRFVFVTCLSLDLVFSFTALVDFVITHILNSVLWCVFGWLRCSAKIFPHPVPEKLASLIIPKNQTHKHTCSFHTFQKLKLDFIVAR